MEPTRIIDGFDICTRSDGSIDLSALYKHRFGTLDANASTYLQRIELMQSINSREAATIAIITAATLFT